MGLLKHPLLIFVISFAVLSLASWIGTVQRARRQPEHERPVHEAGVVGRIDDRALPRDVGRAVAASARIQIERGQRAGMRPRKDRKRSHSNRRDRPDVQHNTPPSNRTNKAAEVHAGIVTVPHSGQRSEVLASNVRMTAWMRTAT